MTTATNAHLSNYMQGEDCEAITALRAFREIADVAFPIYVDASDVVYSSEHLSNGVVRLSWSKGGEKFRQVDMSPTVSRRAVQGLKRMGARRGNVQA